MLTINCNRRNYLSLLLHNFTGFLTLDSILKNAYNSVPSRHKYFAFSGNIVNFEYKYKFTEINLRALRPKQNELYIYIDFGLKTVLQFNSAEFYVDDRFNVQTSERVNALFLKLDRHFNDRNIMGYPYNKTNLDLLLLKDNKNVSLTSYIVNSKFFIDNTFINNLFFSYKGLIEQLSFHFSILEFYNFHFNPFLFAFYNKIPIFTSFVLNSFIDSFLFNFGSIKDILYFGFHWHQSRVNGIYLHKFLFYLKGTPNSLKQKLDLDPDKQKVKTFPVKSKLFFKHIINLCSPNLYRFLSYFVLTFLNKKKKRLVNKFLLLVSKTYLSEKKIKYYMKHKLRHFLLQLLWTFCYIFAKRNKSRQYDYGLSYLLNFSKPDSILVNEYKMIDAFYLDNVDNGLLVKRKNTDYKTRQTTLNFVLKKRFYIGYNILKKIRLSKFNNLISCKVGLAKVKPKWSSNLTFQKLNNKLSTRSLIKVLSKTLSYKQHSFKNWINSTLQYSLFSYLDLLPKGFFYKGFVKDEMYLYYKQFFAGVSLQLSVLRYVLRYLWLTAYLSDLFKKKSTFKNKKGILLNDFFIKIKFDRYLISLVNAFSYSVVTRLKIMNFMTNQLPEPIASEEEKKMKIYWRTIKLDFMPALLSKLNFFDQSNFAFISFSLSFLLLYHFFLYQKRFLFSIGSLFWSKVVSLKNVFKWLFIKETKFNLKFYRAYFTYFIDLIKNNKYLFLSYFYYTLKYNKNMLVQKSTNSIIFSLRFFLFEKLNTLTFLFPTFLCWINLNFNKIIKKNRTYKNYNFFYKKLFLVTNIKSIKSEEKTISMGFKPILFNISHLNCVMNYKQLVSFWDWTNNIKFNEKVVVLNDNFVHVNFLLGRSLFSDLTKNPINQSKNTKHSLMFKVHKNFMSTCTNKFVFSYKVLSLKRVFFSRKKLLKVYNKQLGLNKIFKFYKIFSIFFRRKKCVTKLFSVFFYKRKVLSLGNLSKNRLLFLFNNGLNSKFLLRIFFSQVKSILLALSFSKSYIFFFCSKLLSWLRFVKFSLTLKTIRVFIFSFLYCLQRFFFKSYFNKFFFFNRIKQFFFSFFSNIHFMPFLDLPNRRSFFEPILQNVSLFFFNNSANLFNVFHRQYFKVHNKLRDIKHLQLENRRSVNLFTRVKEPHSFMSLESINFKSSSFLFFKRCGDVFRHFGFLFFTKFLFLRLFFFPFFSKNKTKFFPFAKKLDFMNKFSFVNILYTLKRLRFVVFLLNKLFLKNKNIKDHFWLNTLCIFKILFKHNTYKKKTLYKYSFSLYKAHSINNTYLVRKTLSKRTNRFVLALLRKYRITVWHSLTYPNYKYRCALWRFIGKARGFTKINRKLKGDVKPYPNKYKKQKLSFIRNHYKTKRKYLKTLLLNFSGRSIFLRRFLNYTKIRLNSFFVWLFLYKRFSLIPYKNSSYLVLWKKGISYHLNKLRFYYYKFYSIVFPFRKKPIIRQKYNNDFDFKRMTVLSLLRVLSPLQFRFTKNYNIDFLIGNFIQRPLIFCLTRLKKRKFENKINQLIYSMKSFFPLWKQRLFIVKPGNKMVRTDLVYILRYLIRFGKRYRSFLVNKLYYILWNYYKNNNLYFDSVNVFKKKVETKDQLALKKKKQLYIGRRGVNRFLLGGFDNKTERIKINFKQQLLISKRFSLIKKKNIKCNSRFTFDRNFFNSKILQSRRFNDSSFELALNDKNFRSYYNLLPWHKRLSKRRERDFRNGIFEKYQNLLKNDSVIDNHIEVSEASNDATNTSPNVSTDTNYIENL